jgi:hypothetical protein
MSQQTSLPNDPGESDESAALGGTDLTEAFERMKQGKPASAEDWLQLNYGTDPTRWNLDAESLAEVPKKIRRAVQVLTFNSHRRSEDMSTKTNPIGSLLEDRNLEGDEVPPPIPGHPETTAASNSSRGAKKKTVPDLHNLPEDPPEATTQAGLEAYGRTRLR